ncbi:hypothetical protein D3C78_1309700 [compost metagenome]
MSLGLIGETKRHQYMIDNTIGVEPHNKQSCNNYPRDKVRKITRRLNDFFQGHILDFVKH